MSLTVLLALTFLGLFCGVDCLGEKCWKDKDCLGYVRFSGYRCVDRKCTCANTRACDSYSKVAQREGRYYCTQRKDCEAYDEYPGVLCKTDGTCGCIKHFACGGCLPRLEVLRMSHDLNETCVFDMYGNNPFWTVLIGTDTERLRAGDICFGLNWQVIQTVWKIYRISYVDNFEILEENLINTQTIDGRWGNLDDLGKKPINGLFAMQVNVQVKSDYGYNQRFNLTGYFAGSCAKSYEETQDPRYHVSEPYCDSVNQEVVNFGGNVTYSYTYELPKCFDTSAVYFPAEPLHTIAGCSVEFSCPTGCDSLLNPLVETEFTVDIGCSYQMKLIELFARNCATASHDSCYNSKEVRDSSVGTSVKYKPRKNDLSWNYHGLFVKIYVTTATFIAGNQLVRYGPVPEVGTCDISPLTGYALTTKYDISCTGFSVTHDLELKYTVFSNHVDDLKTATNLYTALSPNRTNMLLQQGKEATGYTVHIFVKAAVSNGAYVYAHVKTQVKPPPETEQGGVVGLAESFLSVDESNSSFVKDLITQGNSQEATLLLGAITSSLNLHGTSSVKKTQVRTSIMTALTEIPVTGIEDVSSTVGILNKATKVTEEVSEQAQDMATDLYVSLADNFDNLVVDQSSSHVSEVAESLLDGVTKMLDVNRDVAFKIEHIRLMAQTEVGAPQGEQSNIAIQNPEAVQKLKDSAVKLLGTVSKVSSTLVNIQTSGAETKLFETGTMKIGVQKLSKKQLSTASYTVNGTSNNRGSFFFTDLDDGDLPGGEQGIKMMYMEKNPYVWAASGDITSPILAVSMNANNTPVDVHGLQNPVAVTLSSPAALQTSVSIFGVGVVKNRIDLEDPESGNVSLDETRPHMLTFSIRAVQDRTISLSVVPLGVIKSFKMLIKGGSKPTLHEIIEEGFLYPEEIPRGLFADFKYTADYSPSDDKEKRRLYITPNNTISVNNGTINSTVEDYSNHTSNISSNLTDEFSGVYHIGITLDLSDNETLLRLKQNYPDCLGSQLTGCTEDIIMTVEVQTSQLGCFYWNDEKDSWAGEGCEVSPFSTPNTIECLCDHLTSFSGSILVMPNVVDPFDFGLFLTFFDNPVVVTAVIMVWTVYFFLIHWARQADKKDKEKVGVINCPDNNPSDNYVYMVCIVTGWWREAGTHANVYIFLKGSKGRSANHCLTAARRPCFQSGNDDWFLITTEGSLGTLQTVTLWHDNTGTGPHWYLNHVYVKDVQLGKSWHFIYNDWLAVDRGHMLQTAATVEAVTQEEIVYRQKHNFMVKSTHDLRDSHLWISIFSKPAKSTFTRVQRLTCALSLLLTTMLTNIMFYGIPTDDPKDYITAGDVSFNLSAVIIGIESSLIMFPINLMILQLFLKTKPKPWRGTVKSWLDNDLDLQKALDMSRRAADMIMRGLLQRIVDKASSTSCEENNSADENNSSDENNISDENNNANENNHKQESRNSLFSAAKECLSCGKWKRDSESSMSTVDTKSEIETTTPAVNNPKILPWWCLYIAWFLVLSTSLISSYFVMLYGLKYGYNKSVDWLVSFLTGFTQSAFVTQPLKVIGTAVVITLIFRKPAEYDDFGPDVELDQDEVYLHEVMGAEPIHHPTVQPLSKYWLSKLRQRLYLEWLMDITLRDIILYIIYMVVVIFMVHSHRNVSMTYRNKVTIETLLMEPSCTEEDECVSFEDTTTVEGIFSYLEGVLLPVLTDMSVPDHELPTPGANHFLLGSLRLRQQRIINDTCDETTHNIFEKFGHQLPECVGEYSFAREDTGSYNNSWKEPASQSQGTGPWSYQSSWKLKTIPYAGEHATYGGGGFILEVPIDDDPISHLDIFKNSDWIDDRTRVIFVEFTLYIPNQNFFSVVMILFEFTNTGGIFSSHHIFTGMLDHYSTEMGTYLLVCEILFLLFNITFTYIEVKRYRKVGRKEYFKDKWSLADIIQLVFAYTVIALYLQRLVIVNRTLEEFRSQPGFVSFYPAIVSDQILSYIMAFLVSVVIVKSLKLLRFNKKMFMIGDTIALSKHVLISFAIMFTIIITAFGHFTTLAFGPFLSVYQSFGTSLNTLFQFALDTSDIIELRGVSNILGPAYFVSFILFCKWCLLQIFAAILNFGISQAKAKTASRKSKFRFVEYLFGKVKDIL